MGYRVPTTGWARGTGPAIFAVVGLLVMTGCVEKKQPGPSQTRSPALSGAEQAAAGRSMHQPSPTTGARRRLEMVGTSVEGRPIACEIIGSGPDTILIMATIHGNESSGTPLVTRLSEQLHRYPNLTTGHTIILLPVANPDGYLHRVRYNTNGVDLNRNFPADNFAAGAQHGESPLSEPESRAVFQLLGRYNPSRVVSIHQPLRCVDYDGPGEGLARAMAGVTTLPVKRLGSRPGSLGSYVGVTLGVPIVTLELPKEASLLDPDALWEAYGDSLLAAIAYPDAPAAR